MVSGTSTKDGCDAAYDTLARAFGEPTPVTGGFRWAFCREHTGAQVIIELTLPGRVTQNSIVWIFDPDAVGISTFTSVDVNTADGLSWLECEVRRLQRG